jgi:enoyl-CoA hydratase/carnithine racemase
MSDFIKFEREHDLVILTLNRPEDRNALSTQAQWDELVAACERVQADVSIKCVILTGAGTAFSAGVKDMRDKKGIAGGTPFQIRDGYRRGIQRIPLALFALDVPTIAAVNGPAVGAGCDLACMCDIRIAADTARFAESFVKLGIIPGDGGAWLLQRVIGYARAAELTFTGEMIDAASALSIGLVTKVVPAAQLISEARELAARITANPAPALRMAKRLLRQAQTAKLDETLEMSAALQALAHHTAEHDQAVAAFFAKSRS